MQKTHIKTLTLSALMSGAMLLEGCIDTVEPTDYASETQIEKSSDALDGFLAGLAATMVEYDSYDPTSSNSIDWGYPCQMVIRDVMTEDAPVKVTATNYDYFSFIADGTDLSSHTYYTYFYYAKLVNTANTLISRAGGTDTETNKAYVGIGLAYRAMAYLDMARMFEWRQTGFTSLDAQADSVWGLTVPIVTDKTTLAESRDNPRAPFYKMYRFINDDLTKAETLLDGYTRTAKQQPDQSVVYGLMARLWLEMASRFDSNATDLATQVQHEQDADGYQTLGITSANDCYAKAAEYAQKAMQGYTPTKKSDWYDASKGFNTETTAWMWKAVARDKDYLNSWYYTWMGTMNNESNYCFGHYGTYRCVGAKLYSTIEDGDWRKKTWIDPNDTIQGAVREGYTTVLDSAGLAKLPEFANLKYHTGSGNVDDYQVCLLCDIPLMRVEEMEYIYLEAIAHTQGAAAAATQLQAWTNSYRYSDNSYTCTATSLADFTEELLRQKRIELWGEGLIYFDYKRLGHAVRRTYEGTNFAEDQRLNSKEGYVAPWMNYWLPDYEGDFNPAVVENPDPSGAVTSVVSVNDLKY